MRSFLSSKPEGKFLLLLGFLFFIPFSIAVCYVLAAVLLIAVAVDWLRRRAFPQLPPFCYLFGGFAAATLLSTIFAVDRWHSLKDNRELLIFLLLPLFLSLLRTEKQVRLSLWAVLLAQVISAALGIIFVLRHGLSLNQRLQGLTSHWMTYSGLLMLSFIFFAVYAILSNRLRGRLLIFSALPFMLAAIVLSLTRSVWLGIGLAALLFLICCKRLLLLPMALAALLCLLFLPGTVKQRLVSIVNPADPANHERLLMWRTGWHIFRAHPLTGVGSDNIPAVYKQFRQAQDRQDPPHLHNNFVQILAERGLLAFLFFTAAWIFLFRDLLLRRRRNSPWLQKTTSAVLFMLVSFLVAGMFEYNAGDSEIRFLLYYFLSLPFLAMEDDCHDEPQAH